MRIRFNEPVTHASAPYGSWHKPANGEPVISGRDYLLVEEATGSDYSGCSVTVANFREFCKLRNDRDDNAIVELFGGHGTYGIAIACDAPADIMEMVDGLRDYPCIDDESVSEVEEEWRQEAASDIVRDAMREIRRELPDMTDAEEESASATVEQLLWDEDTEWHMEHASAWTDPSKLAARFLAGKEV